MDSKIKLIIDTDNGTDIDDIITLYYALKSDVEIVGIISSFQNTQLRTLQIKHVLKLFNREDIPVFAGCGKPILGLHGFDLDNVYCQYTADLGEVSSNDYLGEEAINFLISKAKEYKDQLTILEIAPETTLAKAIQKDREAFKDSHIRIMGGHFFQDSFEWNIECDAEAARIISNSGLDLTYIGLDVCNCTEIKNKAIIDLFFNENKDKQLNYLVQCVNAWQKTESRGIILYDPIAFLSLIDESLCQFEEHKIIYELRDNGHAYLCLNEEGKIAKIAKNIDISRLHSHIYRLFNKEK